MSTIRVTTEATSTPAPSAAPNVDTQPEYDADKSTEDSTQAIVDDEDDGAAVENDAGNEHIESATHIESDDIGETESFDERIEETTTIDQQLRKISDEIDRLSQTNDATGNTNPERHSFLSLNDLMKSLRTADKPDKRIIPQIDSAYSNTMHVLGETASIVGGSNGDDLRRHTNRAL